MTIEALKDALKKDWPTLDDFTQQRVFLDHTLIEKVESLIQSNRICLIRGAEGRGKTVIARVIGFDKDKKGWKVYVIDVSAIRKEEIQYRLNNIKDLGDERALFIIENAHRSFDEITPEFVKYANDAKQKASFIFTLRKIFPGEEFLFMENPFEQWEKEGLCVDLNPDLGTVKCIIENFVEKTDFTCQPSSLSGQDINWIENEIGKTNLRRLSWYLKTWSDVGGPLSGVTKEEVLRKVLKDLIMPLDVNLQEMLLKVAAVYQFDVNFYGKNFDGEVLHELVREGIITALSGYYYRLQHSSDAAYIIAAEAIIRARKTPAEITTNILKHYSRGKPENYYQLLRALYDNKEKTILSHIFKDQETYEVILEVIKDAPVIGVSRVLMLITWSCGNGKGQEFWSQYRDSLGRDREGREEELRGKLEKASLWEINYLLASTKKLAIEEKDRIATLFLKLEADILERMVSDAAFGTVQSLVCRSLPKESLVPFIQRLDPVELGKKAKTASLQHIMWFLRSLESCNKDFAKAFLGAIPEESLKEKMRTSPKSVTLTCLRRIGKVDASLQRRLKNALSADRLKILLSSGLSQITWQLGGYCHAIGEERQFAQSAVVSLSSKDLTQQIKELYVPPQANPMEVLGKLLNFAYQIAFETNPQAIKNIAQLIIQEIDLTQPEKYNLEQLSLLVANVEKCDETLCKHLCRRILSDISLTEYVNMPFNRALAYLVRHLHKHEPTNYRLQQLINKILNLNFREVLNTSETRTINLLIWTMLQINHSGVQDWIKNVEIAEWIQKAKPSSALDSFWLLWSLYPIDEELSKSVAHSLSEDILPSLSVARADDLALLGFFIFCGIQLKRDPTMPPAYEIADKLSETLRLSELAFSLLCLRNREGGKILVENFSQELARCLATKHLVFSVDETLSKHPFDTTRRVLQNTLKDFSLFQP